MIDTFSDAIATVRWLFWQATVLEKASYYKDFEKLPWKFQKLAAGPPKSGSMTIPDGRSRAKRSYVGV
ncbi:MAG: hypothetical protein GY845_31440 [Planctomycetes bacterium]|nr:hypothetical protein [Planctomycetota bacterium]